jgi:aspartyl-tRNA(Asn)/glutamyl-tRNA(Gln) amidotransferase subunit A
VTVLRDLTSVRRALRDGTHLPEDLLELVAESSRSLDEGSEPIGAFLSTVFDAEGTTVGAWPEGGGVVRVEDEGTGLEGAPVAVKDNICTLGLPTTCGSKILEGYRSP